MIEKAKKILVIDDEPEILDVTRKRLEAAGFKVVTAETGLDGLKKARSEKPDLIVLDLILPGLSGYQICAMLKGDQNYREIPILMLSARSQENDVKEGMRVGAEAYMMKPCDAKDFIAKVQELLNEAASKRSVK